MKALAVTLLFHCVLLAFGLQNEVSEISCGKLYYRTAYLDEKHDTLFVGAMDRLLRIRYVVFLNLGLFMSATKKCSIIQLNKCVLDGLTVFLPTCLLLTVRGTQSSWRPRTSRAVYQRERVEIMIAGTT